MNRSDPDIGLEPTPQLTIRAARGALGEATLRTDRLTLRPQEVGDAEVFHRLWGERDERVPAHRKLDADGRPTVSDIATHIAGAKSARSDLLTVADRSTGDICGHCGLIFEGNGSVEEPEIAFELLRDVHGRGYATEAGRAVLAWAVSAGFARIWASVWEWNIASRRVLEKLGFVDSGREMTPGEHGRNILTVAIHQETPATGRGAGILMPGEQLIVIEHGDLSESHVAALSTLFDIEYSSEHGPWDPDCPYGYSPADVHTIMFRGSAAVAHVGFQRRRIHVGTREIAVAGTGGVLVHPAHRSGGVGRRVMSHAQSAMRDDDHVEFGYLGCREEVVPFYERTGWSRVHAVERHVSLSDPHATVTSAAGPILVFAAATEPQNRPWPHGDIDLRGTPW
ncbi:GNAT family N-acetyltransferase [Microbacterium sp. NPDC087589]|uniref:GNAT family N-acetyltransferase n=1 Tax=Microbacterium sp. NPDC087589 TaxID=3364191 RepID=UPI0037FE81A0